MLLDRLLGKNKPEKIPHNTEKNEEFIDALAQYAAQSITFGVLEPHADIPEFQGDYAQAIFLWATSNHTPIRKNDDYPSYLLYECGIRKPFEYHRKMIEEGFLQRDSFEMALQSLKASELKEIAEKKRCGYVRKKGGYNKTNNTGWRC